MNTDCLDHQLTEKERQEFDTKGYFIVENALDADQCKNLIEASKRADADFRQKNEYNTHRVSAVHDFIGYDQQFVDLLDWHKTFPKVWGLMGWNIQLYHSHMTITPPLPDDTPREPKRLGWHQDSPVLNAEMGTNPYPMISLKVGFFLTDTRETNRGNFHIIPGSHLLKKIPPNDGLNPQGMTPVCIPAGSAAIFDRRIWHAASPNYWTETRRVLFYGYSYRWLRFRDDMSYAEPYRDTCNPIQSQLLFPPEIWGPGSGDNLPLRKWMEENLSEETVASND